MPKRKTLSPRKKRILSKIGLMPFTSNKKIAKRFRIQYKRVQEIVRKNPKSNAIKMEKIDQFLADSGKKDLLMHPKIWMLARVRELAPALRAGEIVKTLQDEKAKFPHLKRVAAPTIESVEHLIYANKLRTAEQSNALNPQHHKKKPRNNLTPAQRLELIAVAERFIRNMETWARKKYGDELADIVRARIEEDAQYCRITTDTERTTRIRQWLSYLTRGRKFLFLQSLRILKRKKVKIAVSIGAKTKLPEKSTPPHALSMKGSFQNINIENLTPRQKQVVQLLSEGRSRKEIASITGTTQSNIQALLQKIREGIRTLE